MKEFNPINIGLLSVFSRLYAQMKRVNNIAWFESSTSFSEAITVYDGLWAGCGGLGREIFMEKISNFQLHVDYGQYLGRGYIAPPPQYE